MAYRRNTLTYTKSGRRRPGVFCESIKITQREDPAKKDRENRKEVAKRVKEMVEKGIDLNEVIDIIANQDDIKEKFGYLLKHGIDIKNTIKNIYLATINDSKKYYPHIDERGE